MEKVWKCNRCKEIVTVCGGDEDVKSEVVPGATLTIGKETWSLPTVCADCKEKIVEVFMAPKKIKKARSPRADKGQPRGPQKKKGASQ